MSKFTDKIKSEFEGDATVIVDTHDLEEKIRMAKETGAVNNSDVVIYPDGLDLSEFVFDDDDITLAEPSPKAPPVIEKRVAEKRPESTENAKRIIAEKAEEKERKASRKRRMIIIISAVFLVIALVIGSLAIRSAAQQKKYEESFNAAQNYYYDGEYDKALDTLRQIMQSEKTDECLLLMSACYEAKGDYVNAIAILESSNTGSEAIKERIETLKKAKEEYESGKTVLICGEPYDVESTMIDLSGKRIRSNRLDDLKKLEKLTNLKLNNNLITSLDFLTPMTKLVTLDLSDNKITDISPISSLQSLRTLHLDNNQIKDFKPLYSLRNLTTLTISGMEISESQLKELKEALPDCIIFSEEASEDVVEIHMGGKTFNSNVKELDLSNCGLTDIYALSVCTKLTSLNLSGNYIQDLTPLMDMPELKNLDISNNRISGVGPLMGLAKLERLNLEGNSISSIAALGDLSKLTELYLKGNTLKNISGIAKLTELKYLGLQKTGIDDASLSKLYNLKNLKSLALDENSNLTQAAIDELKKKLPDCKISYTETAQQIEIGGAKINADAQTVMLSGLGITDVSPLSGLTKVEFLDLSDNNISDFTALYGLQTLKELDVSGNNISPEQLSELEQALPNCRVNVM
ncbi:MAG: leucine-rich repeat domain-containing protein [Bacillota bacterium]|nr:leucine-rich repeat domain-containing protein [Bacillota bacterium]